MRQRALIVYYDLIVDETSATTVPHLNLVCISTGLSKQIAGSLTFWRTNVWSRRKEIRGHV